MARALVVILVSLALVADANKLKLKSKAQSMSHTYAELGKTVPAIAALCKKGDFQGAIEVAMAHGKPLFRHAKDLMKACFTDAEGKCTLGEVQCEYQNRCLSSGTKPCGQPPIEEIFKSFPDGASALAEMKKEEGALQVNAGELVKNFMNIAQAGLTSAISDATEALAGPKWKESGDIIKGTAWKEGEKAIKGTEWKMIPGKATPGIDHSKTNGKSLPMWGGGKSAVGAPASLVKSWPPPQYKAKPTDPEFAQSLRTLAIARGQWMEATKDEKKRKWFYEIATLGLFYLLACGTEYNGVKMIGVGKSARPVYAWYAPQGIFNKGAPAWTGPIYNSKLIANFKDFKC